ncbi:MAG: response regulator [Proteobacteria bacterium]|nr:response regulator [Pseudomonadota bacterium]MBU4288036.1 response regulator [Pseudomonadota bacterium]MBU4415035.1 response regulator [Pseudomonadota bacterium]
MKIKHYIQKTFETTDAYAGIDSVEKRLRDNSFLVVLNESSFIGILTPFDIIESPHNLVIDCLHEKPRIDCEQDIELVLKVMKESQNYVLPVFNGDAFIGVVLQAAITDFLFEYRNKLDKINKELKIEIEERKHIEKALMKSENKYRRLVETMNEGLGVLDEARIFIYANDTLCKMLGYSKDEIIGHPVEEFIDESSQNVFKEQITKRGEVKKGRCKIAMKGKNGKKVSTIISATPFFDADDHFVGSFAVITDISELKQVHDELQSVHLKLQAAFNAIKEDMSVVDLDFNLTDANDSIIKSFGLSGKESVLGRKCFEVFKGRKNVCPGCAVAEVYKTKSAAYRTSTPEDEELTGGRIFEIFAYPIMDRHGNILGAVEFARDITYRKRAEEALKKANKKLKKAVARANEMTKQAEIATQAKSRFLANMSHEIRTPLNAVIGFTSLLMKTSLDENQLDYARTIQQSSKNLLALINDILDFSRIEAGELEIKEIDFDLKALANDVCEIIRPKIESKPVEILSRISDSIPLQIKGDKFKIQQVLVNLMNNACKFTESGEIELFLDIEEEKDDRLKFHAKVRDTGIGISHDLLTTIFKPFHQADSSNTRKYGGTGLGLSICRQISNLMHGDVWAESEVGKGSIFHFTAWIGKSEVKETAKHAPISLSGRKVLIVDDDQASLYILMHALESLGARVISLQKVKEVIPILQKAIKDGEPFDLCVTDIKMPGMSGHELAKQIHASASQCQNLPLIALSSYIESEIPQSELSEFDGFLSKPVTKEKLIQVFDKITTHDPIHKETKRSARILLAEDDPISQKLSIVTLTKAGHKVEIAANGREAVEKYFASPDDFDLIFMDVSMPEMNGLNATRAIREKGFESIPIVAMTAHAVKGDRKICLESGMNDYITKPVEEEVIFDILEKWVFNRNSSDPPLKRR